MRLRAASAQAIRPPFRGCGGTGRLAHARGGGGVGVGRVDVGPVGSGIYFCDDGDELIAGDDGADHPVTDVVSSEDGVRVYLYTRYELVTVRAKGA